MIRGGTRAGLVVAAIAGLAACASDDAGRDAAVPPDAELDDGDRAPDGQRRIVVLMIGDGMGPAQIDGASLLATGETGRLFLQSLPVHGRITTGNLSGITDSAAAATTLATGVRTFNQVLGLDRDGRPVENLVELAHRLHRRAGVVTTSLLPHATPAGFSAHGPSRYDYLQVVDSQVLEVRPDVMLGGGARYFDPPGAGSVRTSGDLSGTLRDAGFQIVRTADDLTAIDPSAGDRVLGVFADQHLSWVRERAANTTEPTLAQMSRAALELLDRDPDGFFLMIEGARIDMAGHNNDLANALAETLAFDDAVREVGAWAAGRPEVTLLVTADHETGGLRIEEPGPAGELPVVGWRWGQHTNTRVDLYGQGPGSEVFADQVRDQAWVHAAMVSSLTGAPLRPPAQELVADGHLADLAHLAVAQTAPTGFGEGYNQLDALWLDADDRGLSVGVEGLFEWGHNALVVLLDTDLGAGTGPSSMVGALHDDTGVADQILSSLALQAPATRGWGVDFAIVSQGGTDPRVEDLWDRGGLRGLHPPVGLPTDLGWFGVATNFGDDVRTDGFPASPVVAVLGEGWEARIDWSLLYPGRSGRVPEGATIGIAVVMVDDEGDYTSNQALPPFAADAQNPGSAPTPLPGVVRFVVDSDLDGVGDGSLAPIVDR